MKMKHIILIISILIFSQIYVSAQSLTDTLSDQQKQEILNRVLIEMMMKAEGGDHKILTNEQKEELTNQIVNQLMMNVFGKNHQKVDDDREKQRLDSIRQAVEAKYKPGTMAPDFLFQDINGKTVTLKDLRGKYVYMDIWATWCGPCKKELPYLRQLEERMKGKKILFVSVSWDRNRKEWVKMVKEEKLEGVQLHFNEDETFFNELGVSFIPRFLLLDKKGRIVDIDMSRPSMPETEKSLLKLKGI